MSVRWTQTNAVLDGFFALLACEKCKKTPEKPIRLVMCGHTFCNTCCTENTSVCMKCDMPVTPNEIQPHHLVAQLINYCQTIKEAIGEINTEDKRSSISTKAMEFDAKNITVTDNGDKDKDSMPDTPGFRDPTQTSPRSEKNEEESNTPGYRDPTQVGAHLKLNESESETPGYRDLTQMSSSLRESNDDSETLGYRDPTQVIRHEKEGNLKVKISRRLAQDPDDPGDRAIEAMDVVQEDYRVNSDVFGPKSIEVDKICTGIDDEANTAIAENMEIADKDPNHDTVSVKNFAQEWTQMVARIPKKIIPFSSEHLEANAVQLSKVLVDSRETTRPSESKHTTDDLEPDRHELQDTVEDIFESEPAKTVETPKTVEKGDLAKCSAAQTSKTADSRPVAKKQQPVNVEKAQRKNLSKLSTKTSSQSKRRPRATGVSAIPKIMPKNVNKRNAKGESILHTACVKGQSDYVAILLKAGANPNTKDNANWTPLQEAVNLGHRDICKMLLESGASPNTPGMENRTALHDAAIHDKVDEALRLLRFNANRDVYDKFGKRPIDYAVSDEMRALLTDNSNVEKLADGEISCLNRSLDHSILIPNAKVVVFPSDLSSENKKLLMQMASKLKVSVATTFRPGITHVVVEANERNITKLTYNVMLAILEGKWILNSQWIAISTDLTDISEIDLEIFQVHGAPNPGTPERSRLNEEKQNPRLFNNCFFYFTIGVRASWDYGKSEFTKQSLTSLVLAGEGEVLNREPDPEGVKDCRLTPFHVAHRPLHPLHRCSYYIIYMPGKDEPRVKYNMPHIKTLPLAWFFECIEKFELVDPILMGIS